MKKYRVIHDPGETDPPKKHEDFAAKIIADYFKRTMANNLREASGQSKNVVIDLSRCKMNNSNALSRICGFMNSGDSHLKKLLIIDKAGNVLDFFRDVR